MGWDTRQRVAAFRIQLGLAGIVSFPEYLAAQSVIEGIAANQKLTNLPPIRLESLEILCPATGEAAFRPVAGNDCYAIGDLMSVRVQR